MKTTRRTILKNLSALTAAGLAPGCGYLLFPERINQDVTADSRLDLGVVILDGILLIPGVLPGLIAFIIDVSTGCIYLPLDPPPQELTARGLRRLRARGRRQRDYEVALAEASGLEIRLDDPRLRFVVDQPSISAEQLAALVDDPDVLPTRRMRLQTDADGAVTGFAPIG